MSRRMSDKTKYKLIEKLNNAFNWDIDADRVELVTDRTSGAFRWSSIYLNPQIHSEFITAEKLIKAKELSYYVDDDIGRTVDIMNEPFKKSSFFSSFDKPEKVEFTYQEVPQWRRLWII